MRRKCLDHVLIYGRRQHGWKMAVGFSGETPVGDVDMAGDFALARYRTSGALDHTFGAGGKVLTDFSGRGSADAAFAVAIQADGKIVAADSDARGSQDFALARYVP